MVFKSSHNVDFVDLHSLKQRVLKKDLKWGDQSAEFRDVCHNDEKSSERFTG